KTFLRSLGLLCIVFQLDNVPKLFGFWSQMAYVVFTISTTQNDALPMGGKSILVGEGAPMGSERSALIKDAIWKLSGITTEFSILNGLYIADVVNNEDDSTMSWEFSNYTHTTNEQLYIMHNKTHQYDWEYETKLILSTKDIYDIYNLFYSTPICMFHEINVGKREFSEKAIPIECYNTTDTAVKALCSITYDGKFIVVSSDKFFTYELLVLRY
ncbi:conserved hypothetical protein, partial [Trichinella spiralis]|uniref:hypothetical protein n=1 Tax=Trichinella spiralis TaxID=6334 RepID=UPI0001EFDAE3